MVTDIQTRFSDFDMMYHVNNIAQQYYFDLGNVAYFRRVLGIHSGRDDMGLIKVRVEVNFYEPIEVDDKICVTTKVERIGTKSITMWQEIICKKSGRVKSDSRTVMVGYRLSEKQSLPIPQQWRDAIETYEKHSEEQQ